MPHVAPGSHPVIYADAAFVQNFILSLVWLWATAALAVVPVRFRRLLLGSVVAAIAGVWALLPSGRLLVSLWGIAGAALGTLGVTYAPCPWRRLLRLGLAFLLSGAAMAGAMQLSVGWLPVHVIRAGSQPVVRGGVLGRSFTPVLLAVACALLLVAAARLWRSSLRRGATAQAVGWLALSLGGVQARVRALLDTGNSLREPISGDPVLVVEAAVLVQVGCLPPDVGLALASGELAQLPASWRLGVRVVPMRTAAGSGRALLAVRAEAMQFVSQGQARSLGRAWVAFCREPLHPEGAFEAIVPPAALLEQGEVEVDQERGFKLEG